MDAPTWIARHVVDAAHYMQLREHGGAHGVRDENALESALARPQHRHRYEPESDLASLAAAYAFALATSHPFVDGNKRTAFVVAAMFLDLNGHETGFAEQDVIDTMRALADGKATEGQIADWFRASLRRRPPPAGGDPAARTG